MPDKALTKMTPVSRLFRLLGKYRKVIRYTLLYAIVIGLINLTLPLGIQAIIGQIAGGRMNASWGVMVLFVITGALLVGLLRIMQISVMEYMQRSLFTDASIEFALRIPRFNLESLRNEHLPELVNRFFDTLTLQKGLPKILMDGSTAILQILFSLILLSFYHSAFVMSALLLLGALALFFYWTAPLGIESSLKESKYKYKLVYWLEETGRVAETFKLAGDNVFPLQRADDLTIAYLDARKKHWRILIRQIVGSMIFRVLVLGGFLILGSLLVMNNQLNIGQFVASEILILFVIESVEKIILLHETGYDVLTAIEKIGQVSDLPLEREDGIPFNEFYNNKPLEVELRNLSYQYEDAENPVLNNLNLKVNAGERIAIAGYNGSGKSTLMQILSVLKQEFTGSLLFNGLPLQNLHLRSLREHIGDLSSREDVFKGSIRENIALGNAAIKLPELLKVIEEVGLSNFIRELPAGIDTEILPGGRNISRSTIAKILIARSIVSRPQLLVVEEWLGNLNYRDRLRIAQLLTDRSQPWSLICVTEDPIIASMSDRVIVLKAGEIVFDGKFDDLQKTPHYEKVFRTSTDTTL